MANPQANIIEILAPILKNADPHKLGYTRTLQQFFSWLDGQFPNYDFQNTAKADISTEDTALDGFVVRLEYGPFDAIPFSKRTKITYRLRLELKCITHSHFIASCKFFVELFEKHSDSKILFNVVVTPTSCVAYEPDNEE